MDSKMAAMFYRFSYLATDKIIEGEGSYADNNPENKIKYGINYGIMPKFSFSTPLIKKYSTIIANQYDAVDLGELKMGVGHIKICSDPNQYPYEPNSNIQKFRENLYRDMKNLFGDRYIRHKGTGRAPNCYGYIYLMYFFIIILNDNKMRISDAFLPVYFDDRYKFSLIYPMGITDVGNKIYVIAGEGDYYSVVMQFDFDNITNLCIHDVNDLDMNQYKYKIIMYKNNKVYIDETILNMNLKGGYNKKYRLKC